MQQTKYALAVPKNWGVGVDFQLCSEGNFLTGRLYSVLGVINVYNRSPTKLFGCEACLIKSLIVSISMSLCLKLISVLFNKNHCC